MKTTLLALAVALSGTAALADNVVTLSYTGFEQDDVTARGLIYDFEGQAGGFGYDGYVFDGDIEDFDAKAAGAKISWTGVDVRGFGVGPAISYDQASVAGSSSDGWAAGVAARGAFGRHEVDADLLVSFDDKEVWALDVEGETAVNDKTTILTNYVYAKDNSRSAHQYFVGARYDLTPTSYVEGEGLFERSFGETGLGMRAGVGFRF